MPRLDQEGVEVACGDFRIAVSGLDALPKATRAIEVVEGSWPEPLGLRLKASSTGARWSWSAESDAHGVRPVYWGFDGRHRPVVSTRPEVVAAMIGARVSASSVAESLLVGYPLDCHSPYAGVRRLRPNDRLVHSSRGGFDIQRGVPAEQGDDDWIDRLGGVVAGAFADGAALEMSGGVDSRLVLALGLHAGEQPRLAFTLGADDDADVRIAREICSRYGIEHLVLPTRLHEQRLVADGRRFIERSGFTVNACSWAWLPGVFDRLAGRRTAQIGGGGGECATGFYYSPFDALCVAPSLRRMWVGLRLFRSGIDVQDAFGAERGRHYEAETTDTVLRSMASYAGSWRRRTDRFYLGHRVPNCVGPVLAASASWYAPVQPLLHAPYISWGGRLATKEKAGRRAQRALIHELAAPLEEIPYAGHKSTVRRISGRLHRRPARPDLGAATTATALVKDVSIRQSLHELGRELDLRGEYLDRLIAAPATHPHELGVLVTAAWAAERVAALPVESRLAEGLPECVEVVADTGGVTA